MMQLNEGRYTQSQGNTQQPSLLLDSSSKYRFECCNEMLLSFFWQIVNAFRDCGKT